MFTTETNKVKIFNAVRARSPFTPRNVFDRVLLIGPLMNGKALSVPPVTQTGAPVIIMYSRPELMEDMIKAWPEELQAASFAFLQAKQEVKESRQRQEYVLHIEPPSPNWFLRSVKYLRHFEDGVEIIEPAKNSKPMEMIIEWEERVNTQQDGEEWSF